MDSTATLSNSELGRLLGVCPSMASRIRNGHRRPGTATMRRISQTLGVDLRDLHEAHERGAAATGRLVTAALDARAQQSLSLRPAA